MSSGKYLTVNTLLAVLFSSNLLSSKLIDCSFDVTETSQVAGFTPDTLDVAVIVVVPLAIAVTFPSWSTVATSLLLELHIIFLLSVVLLGLYVTLNFSVCVFESSIDVLFKLIDCNFDVTETWQVAGFTPNIFDVAVIVAVPGAIPFTFPLESTVAMFLLLDDQAIFLLSVVSTGL